MVGFDQFVFAVGTALDDVGKNGALGKKFDFSEFFGFFLEHADKLFADDFTFLFGVGNADEFVEETVLGVHRYEVHSELLFKHFAHLLEFALAEQTVVDENADEVVADGFVNECGAHRTVDAAGKPEQHFFVADLFAYGGNLLFDEVLVHRSS